MNVDDEEKYPYGILKKLIQQSGLAIQHLIHRNIYKTGK
jgi:hypothetical protein